MNHNELIANALAMWANHIETGSVTLSVRDAAERGLRVRPLDTDQQLLVDELRMLSRKHKDVSYRALHPDSCPKLSVLVDFPDGRPFLSPSVSKALAENRVVSIKKKGSDEFEVLEMCDKYFGATLTREQLELWGYEIIALANNQQRE